MVNYTCQICNKTFTRKNDLVYHMEKKKKPCQQFTPNFPENAPICPNFTPICPNFTPILPKSFLTIEQTEENYCGFCGLAFKRKYHLKRHMDSRCKVKKLQNEEKENILEMIIEKDKEVQNKKIEELEKNKEIQNKKIEELQKVIESLNNKIDKQLNKVKTTNINKGVINNIVIPQNKLVDFGSEDVSKIPQETIRDIVKLSGYPAIVGCFNALHNNKEYPQGMNGYVSDKSRDKGMIWKDGGWQQVTTNKIFLACMNKIDTYIQYSKGQIENGKYNIKNDPKGKKLLNDLEQRVIKYYDRYLGDDYTVSKKVNKDFEKLVKENIINELCNIKEHVIANYEKILDDMKNNDKLENKEQQIKDNKEVMNNLIDKIDSVGKKKLKEIVDEEFDLQMELQRKENISQDDEIILPKKSKVMVIKN